MRLRHPTVAQQRRARTASEEMGDDSSATVKGVVESQLGGVRELDDDIFAYILGIVQDVDSHGCDPETLTETVRGWENNGVVVVGVQGYLFESSSVNSTISWTAKSAC